MRYDEYPGGLVAYWRDYRATLATYFEYQDAHQPWDGDEGEADSDNELTETPQQKVDRYAYYALKRMVFDVSVVVAALAGIHAATCPTGWSSPAGSRGAPTARSTT